MKTLHLTLKKKWFDLWFHPDPDKRKNEEYREVTEFWIKRLMNPGHFPPSFKEWDAVLGANGGHFGDVPKGIRKFEGISIGEGKPEWGAVPGEKYFVIKLGEAIS